jgi:hypothetical protein
MLSENIAFEHWRAEHSPGDATHCMHAMLSLRAQVPHNLTVGTDLFTHFRSRLSFAVRIHKTSMIDYTFLLVLRDAKHVFPSLLIFCYIKVAYHVGDRFPDRYSLGHAANFGDVLGIAPEDLILIRPDTDRDRNPLSIVMFDPGFSFFR